MPIKAICIFFGEPLDIEFLLIDTCIIDLPLGVSLVLGHDISPDGAA